MKVSCRERVRSVNRRARDGSSAGCSRPVARSWSLDRHGIGCSCRDHIREYRPLVPTRSGGRVVRSCSLAQFRGLSRQHSPRWLPDGLVLRLFSGSRPPKDSFVIAPLAPGKYSYHCELHPIMRGSPIVIESQARSEGATSANVLSTTERNTHVYFNSNP